MRQHNILFCLALATSLLALSIPRDARSSDPDDRYWIPVSSFDGQTGPIDAVVSAGDELYLGGRFRTVDGLALPNCVHWNGEHWEVVGGGVGMPQMALIHTMVVHDNDVYVGGMFDQVQRVWPASNIARWDGSNWDTMNGGTDRAVRIIARAPNGDIYAGGEFTTAGGVPARGIARWDGSQWHALGSGVDQHVMAIAFRGDDVYVGGRFSTAGGKRIPFVVRWDGDEWHAMGTGVNGLVLVMRFDGGRLLVGGMFTAAGGRSARGIAAWDGVGWYGLGQGVTGPGLPAVRTILVDRGNVIVGGFFTHAGGAPANYIARWDGRQWSALGSGLDYTVKNLAKHDGELLVTGEFEMAGGKTSALVARWYRPAVYLENFTATPAGDNVELSWDAVVNESFSGFVVYRRSDGQPERIISGADPLDPATRRFVDLGPPGGVGHTYSLAAVLEDGSELRADGEPTVSIDAPSFVASQNHPNPFGPSTTVEFFLPEDSYVRVSVYDVAGRLVQMLVDEVRPAGANSAVWNGRDSGGEAVRSGVYFYRVDMPGSSLMRKMVLVR